MLVIDLFSGLGGWSAAFKDRGHEVFTVDIDPRFEPDLVANVFDLRRCDLPSDATAILASPPCTNFSVATAPRDWKEKRIRNRDTLMSIGLVAKSLQLIEEMDPPYWVIENPRGMLQFVAGPPQRETYFASWNEDGSLKPTHLWGKIPEMEWPQAKNWTPWKHLSVRDPAKRAQLPYGLSEALCKAIERELEGE